VLRVKLTRDEMVCCPRISVMSPVKDCLDCPDLFGIVRPTHINCKRGLGKKADTFLMKSKKKERR